MSSFGWGYPQPGPGMDYGYGTGFYNPSLQGQVSSPSSIYTPSAPLLGQGPIPQTLYSPVPAGPYEYAPGLNQPIMRSPVGAPPVTGNEGYMLGFAPDYTKSATIRSPVQCVPRLTHGQFPRPGNILVVFDNKGNPDRPRLAVVLNDGTVVLLLEGDSNVLEANDLESLSLVDDTNRIYAASDSLGHVYVFKLDLDARGKQIYVRHINEFWLIVPPHESQHYGDPNQTNIEAMRVHYHPSLGLCITWAARGGEEYAGRVSRGRVWIRTAPFDLSVMHPDFSRMREGIVQSVTGLLEWREISDIDIMGEYVVFSTAYDGEEQNKLRAGETRESLLRHGKKLFDSQVVVTNTTTGQSVVLAMLPGMKVEAVLCDGTGRVWVGSDDEGLGSIVGELTTLEFLDIGASASHMYGYPLDAWGISGMAAGPFDSHMQYALHAMKARELSIREGRSARDRPRSSREHRPRESRRRSGSRGESDADGRRRRRGKD